MNKTMLSVEELMTSLHDCVITGHETPKDVSVVLELFINKLGESSRTSVKRCKERCLEEAAQLLRNIPGEQLHRLEENHLLLLARLLISMQLQAVNISTASRKLDQMLQCLSAVNHLLVFRETHLCLHTILHTDQILSFEDLQKACMFLEDSAVGREVWRETCSPLLHKVAELFPSVLQQEGLRNGPLCYLAVKVCLQMFQLLPGEVAPLVWVEDQGSPALQCILQALMDIILGQSSNRDARLLAGTAVAMLVNTAAPEDPAGGEAAWNLLHVFSPGARLLTVGGLQVQVSPVLQDGVDRLALSRGLLTCSQSQVLLSSQSQVLLSSDAEDATESCLLLGGLLPLVTALCHDKLDCHYYVFEVLTLWLRKVRESLAALWEATDQRLLPDDGSLQRQLVHVIWNNAESPVEGVSEFVHSAFCLLLEIYEMDCERFGDTKKSLHISLLHRVINLPWEAKAKYPPLCALLPYLGTDMVMDQYVELPNHLLKCLSSNHLSPCASELYKCLIQQQRKELCSRSPDDVPPPELALANRWAARWQSALLEALTSEVTLVQNHSSSHLLPCTLQVFPAAVQPLLAALDPASPGHLHAWACVMSSGRATAGASPWALRGGSARETLRLALGSVEDKVRLAALNLLCCSPRTKEAPTADELASMRTFLPQNLNSESSPFRQHLQAAVKRFLVRIRDSCLAHVRGQKGKKSRGGGGLTKEAETILDQGVGFVEWLGRLPYLHVAPGHSYQRKKTVLLLLFAVLETCTDTWSPDRKKGQPPENMASLIDWARQRGQWDFFCRSNQLVLIGCLEDSTNEIRELAVELLVRFFPPGLPDDVTPVLAGRTTTLLCSPRVPEAEMGALMMKVLLLKQQGASRLPWLAGSAGDSKASGVIRYLVKELEQHYLTAKTDMMLAARTKPVHGILAALERCLLDMPGSLCDVVDHSLVVELLDLLEKTSLLLLGVLNGAQDTDHIALLPSLCDMGNAINSLIAEAGGAGGPGGGRGPGGGGDDCVLLSEEHGLVLTCCWVSLKEIGIFLGSLVERILAESKACEESLLTAEDLRKASKTFKDILLKCRHWGAVEGCCVGFTKFCASLLGSSDPELGDIPGLMLRQGLHVVRSPRSTSVTRRAAGLPMLILCVVSAEESSKSRPLLAHSVHTLLDTARAPLPESWDQTLDLPQVCAVHTLQALVRGSRLGVAVLQFAPAVAMLSLTLLRSPCWGMRNAALQLYSSLCTRMLGQRPAGEEGSTQHGMSPAAFFSHYPALQPFLLGELRGAARDLQGASGHARLRLHPSLYPVLTLLAKLQPGVPDLTGALLDFRAPLLQLASSPIYSVRVVASRALVAMTPPSEYMNLLVRLTADLPRPGDPCCHNGLHGRLLQINAVLDRALCSDGVSPAGLGAVVGRVEASLWLVTGAQRCPLVRGAYLEVAGSLRALCTEASLERISDALLCELHTPPHRLQVGLSSFHQAAVHFLCADPRWACPMWDGFSSAGPDLRLTLVTWALEGRGLERTGLRELTQRVLQSNLREALLSQDPEYQRTYLAALVAVMTAGGDSSSAVPQDPPASGPPESPPESPAWLECVELLLGALEGQEGGPETLSQALCAASLLLGQSPPHSPPEHLSLQSSLFRRWCGVLEVHRAPGSPEALRMACARALCLAGAPLMGRALGDRTALPAVSTRLISTALYLLQDESQPVRLKAACFSSLLAHARRGAGRGTVYLMQVNQALAFLLDLLLEGCWDRPGALEVLLGHLPGSPLGAVLEEATETGRSSLYEQDEANVFSEPCAMSACLLPYLLRLADRHPESPVLARSLSAWAAENVHQVLESLAVCNHLQPGDTLTPAWLALLTDSRFHGSVRGLLARAALLLRLLETSHAARPLCDPATLRGDVQAAYALLSRNSVQLPATFRGLLLSGDPPV